MRSRPGMEMERARTRLLERLRRDIGDGRVIAAMAEVPRERFVPAANRHLAYEDIPLPIEEAQTISQPYIVAVMTQALALKDSDRVLEVGTGSGYQAAVLSRLAGRVVTVERHANLAERAARLLKELGYDNVEVHLAERRLGWPRAAPYDAIIVTAAAPRVPDALLQQLADGGRMVLPVGTLTEQELLLVTVRGDRVHRVELGPCRFVPLVGEEAWEPG